MIMEKMSTATLLPQEIISDILSRLPAKSLVSIFKLVCKDWRNLIKDPDFVKMHLNRRRRSASINNSSLICKSGNDLFQLHPPFNFECGIPPPITIAAELDFDPLSWCGWDLIGSCNGLVCLSVDDDDDTIILLNPSTRRYKISPKQPNEFPKDYFSSKGNLYGFGCCYNSNSNSTTNNKIIKIDDDDDEYKVVRIVYLFGIYQGEISSRSLVLVDIYSMSSNSWRRETNIIELAYDISNQQSGVLVNEALHWVAACTNKGWDTIVSFDIRDEEFRQLPIPLSFHPTADEPYFQMHEVILMNMKECLSMIRFFYGRRNVVEEAADLEIWVMKEYGIKESWTKEFVIRSWDTDPPRALSDFAISPRSNAYVLKGDQILIEGLTYAKEGIPPEGFRKLVLYDINKRKIDGDFKMIGVPDDEPDKPCPRVDQVDYIETLVSLKSSIMVRALDSNLSSSSS